MAEGPEEARGRPPGQDDGGGDPEPVPSLRGSPAAALRPRDGPQAEPQAPGRPPAPGLAPAAVAAEESEPPGEPGKRGETAPGSSAGLQEPAGGDAPEAAAPRDRPVRLSAREYSRQVHEWLWQSYCGYLTWHSGLAAFPAYCSPQPPPPSYPSGGGAPAPQAAAPPPLQLGYYNPFYFLSAAAAGPDPGAATGVTPAAPVAGPGGRAPHAQGSGRATPVSRVGSGAPSRTPSETGRQAGEKRDGEVRRGGAKGSWGSSLVGRAGTLSPPVTMLLRSVGISLRPSAVVCPGLQFPRVCGEAVRFLFPLDPALRTDALTPGTGRLHV